MTDWQNLTCDFCGNAIDSFPGESLMLVNEDGVNIAEWCCSQCMGAWTQRHHISKGKVEK